MWTSCLNAFFSAYSSSIRIYYFPSYNSLLPSHKVDSFLSILISFRQKLNSTKSLAKLRIQYIQQRHTLDGANANVADIILHLNEIISSISVYQETIIFNLSPEKASAVSGTSCRNLRKIKCVNGNSNQILEMNIHNFNEMSNRLVSWLRQQSSSPFKLLNYIQLAN